VNGLGSLLTWSMLRRVRGRVDRVFTISDDGTRAMSALGFAGRVTKVPLGFDPALFHPQDEGRVAATRKRLGLDRPTVAYFGRLAPEKGIDVLLRALGHLRDLPWQLLIDQFKTYHSPYTARLQQITEELGLGDRVVYFDASHQEIPDFMNAADVVVLPSVEGPGVKEQYGRVLPEAMACAKVVVGSNVGAIPELIGDAGSLVPPGDAGALAERLRHFLTVPPADLAGLRARAHRRAHERLSIRTQADVWAHLAQEEFTGADRLAAVPC
jgi:glycosyltransferase involved in cell wall biosynthesis